MALPLDHIVIAVHDLEAAVADYRALGFQVAIGGRHPGRTSHNALVVFADGAYLEIIAWTAPAPEERWYRTLRDHGEGLVDFALLPGSTSQALAEARERGLDTLIGPVDGGRVRPDGAQLLWQTARHATPDLPFLCGDVTPRALRVPEGSVREHPNGALGVASLTVAVHDLQASLDRYRALLGPGLPLQRVDSRSARLALPGFDLLLQGAQTPPSQPADALSQRLATRGEGPCALTLRQGPGGTARPLDPAASHGVDMRWHNGI